MFPDELQHQQLVEVRIEQGSNDRIQFPVVVMRALREVHDHRLTVLIAGLILTVCAFPVRL
jgi:hypothetical protein